MATRIINSPDQARGVADWITRNIETFAAETPQAITIEPWEANRSKSSNAYLWGWLYKKIAEQLHEGGIVIACDDGTEIPYTVDILHDHVFARRFRVANIIEAKGNKYYNYESTSKMKKARFTEYCKQITEFAHQYWRIDVPQPVSGYFKNLLEASQ